MITRTRGSGLENIRCGQRCVEVQNNIQIGRRRGLIIIHEKRLTGGLPFGSQLIFIRCSSDIGSFNPPTLAAGPARNIALSICTTRGRERKDKRIINASTNCNRAIGSARSYEICRCTNRSNPQLIGSSGIGFNGPIGIVGLTHIQIGIRIGVGTNH